MKTYAYAINKKTQEKFFITAKKAIYLREFNKAVYNEYDYYYEHHNELLQVFPKCNESNTAYFAFAPKYKHLNLVGKGGESLTHKAIKDALKNLSSLHMIDKKSRIDITLNVIKEKTECEKSIKICSEYVPDIYFELSEEQTTSVGKEYYYKWYGQLLMEIYVTHKVNIGKSQTFYDNCIPIFEIKISNALRERIGLDNAQSFITIDKYNHAVHTFQVMFTKCIYGRFISNPSSEEYQIMKKYKTQIEQFKKAKIELEKEYTEILTKKENAQQQLDSINSNIDFYNKVIYTNKSLRFDIDELMANKKELEEKNKQLTQTNIELTENLDYIKKHPIMYFWQKVFHSSDRK